MSAKTSTEVIEHRFFQADEMRTLETDGKRIISGYAAVFDKLSQVIYNFREKIQKGAFSESISAGDVRALWSHNTDFVLGRTKSGTLKLREDEHGLFFDIELPDTQMGRDAHTSIKRGDVSGMSFGFKVIGEHWERGKEAQPHTRTLTKVELFEVSPTAFPAYEQTFVQARSLADLVKKVETDWALEDKATQEKRSSKIDDMKKVLRFLDLKIPLDS